MRIAFISQPIDYIAPHFQSSSIGIWTDRVIHSLPDSGNTHGSRDEFIIYAKRFPEQPLYEHHGQVQYRRISTQVDDWVSKPAKLIERLFNYPWPQRPFFASSWSYYLYALQIAQDLRRQQVDIVHIHNYSQLVVPIRALNPKIRIVLHMHCEWLTQLDHEIVADRLRHVDLISGCSDFITNTIRQSFPQFAERCHSIYNGVDNQHFSPAPVLSPSAKGTAAITPVVKNGCKKLLFVGRVSPEKGLHILLKAFEIVGNRLSDAYLDIVGAPGDAPYEYIILVSQDPKVNALKSYYHGLLRHGKYYSELQADIPDALRDRVHFVGYVAHHDLVKHYQAADVLVNPSLSESFGMSLIEAMACQVPVIATRVGGMEEIVSNGETGFSVNANDPQALAEAIFQALSSKEQRAALGKAGYERVLERYTWEQVSKQLWKHYQRLTISR